MSLVFGDCPELLLSLARAASQSCSNETVSGAVATAFNHFFPNVKYCSVQLCLVSDVVVSIENLVSEGTCLVKLLPVHQSLSGLALLSRSMVSADGSSTSLQDMYLDVQLAQRRWDAECNVCIPLFFDATMEVVKKAVKFTEKNDSLAKSCSIVEHYMELEGTAPVIGTVTVGMPKLQAVCEGQLANLVLLSSAMAVNLALDCQDLLKHVGNVITNIPSVWDCNVSNTVNTVTDSAASTSLSQWSNTSEEVQSDIDSDEVRSVIYASHELDVAGLDSEWEQVDVVDYTVAHTEDEGATDDEEERLAGDDCKQLELADDHRQDEGDSSLQVHREVDVTEGGESSNCGVTSASEDSCPVDCATDEVRKNVTLFAQHPLLLHFTNVQLETNYSGYSARTGKWADMLWMFLHMLSLLAWMSGACLAGTWVSSSSQLLNLVAFLISPWPLLWRRRFARWRDAWLCTTSLMYMIVEVFMWGANVAFLTLPTRSLILLTLLQVHVCNFVWLCGAYIISQGIVLPLVAPHLTTATSAAVSPKGCGDLVLVVAALLATTYIVEVRKRRIFIQTINAQRTNA